VVRKAGLEPARVLPTTPSRWRVYQFPPLPHSRRYFFSVSAGAGVPTGGAAGAALSVCSVAGTSEEVTPFMTDVDPPLPKRRARLREVNMKITAAATVIFCKKELAPALPKTVWLEPPKAAPMLAPFPFWRRTIKIRAKQTAI
jgi:hypothetical protein